jgi:flagellar hook-length control protein FliK
LGRSDPTPALPATTAHQLKVLTIQLHPVELGVVTVRIGLKDGALDLQMSADRPDAARLLDADRDALCELLRSAGYSIDGLTVRAVGPSDATAAGGLPRSPEDPQAGGSQSDQRPSGGQTHARRDGNSHDTRKDREGEQSGLRHRADRRSYV